MMRHMRCLITALVLLLAAPSLAQTPQRQTQEDDYTRYELLGPDTAQFRILYEVTATTAGAPYFFNAIRKGSIATDERVADMMTGQPLKWEIVSGAQARKEGHPTADLETEWLKVHLARPVPKGGEARVLIDKTYKDPKSYFRDGDTIVFDRSLGIRRNAIVLPAGYRLISCNVPSQVMSTADGRVMITFMNPGPAAAPLVIRAKPGLAPFTPKATTARGAQSTVTLASQAARLSDRAHQDREIVYFPERSVHALVQPLPRLHRVASGRWSLLQRRSSRQHRVESVGGVARYRRRVEGRDLMIPPHGGSHRGTATPVSSHSCTRSRS